MPQHEINLLKEKYRLTPPKGLRRFFPLGKLLTATLVIGAAVGGLLSFSLRPAGQLGQANTPPSLLSTLHSLVRSEDRTVAGETDDRVNLLLLGVGGEGHDGPQLADTMIFASLKPSTSQVGMISLPRDMIVPIPGYGWRKINHANAFGEETGKGGGPLLAKKVVADVLGQDIHYYVRVDFRGFAKLIDDLDGINVFVDRAFTDYEYPILGKETAQCAEPEEGSAPDYSCRFEVLSFQQGWTHMDGTTALKYVRSRHGTNGESSDFARSRRQQKLLLAVKEKVFTARTFLNPTKVARVFDTLQANIATNISPWELITLANTFKDVAPEEIHRVVLDASEQSPLYATSVNGAYVLLPKNDDWTPVRTLAQDVFETKEQGSQDRPSQPKEPVVVEIQNGTQLTGLAFHVSQLLDGRGFDVKKLGNASERGYEQTIVYDFTDGKKRDELKALQELLEAEVALSAAGWLAMGEIVPREIHVTPDDYATLATQENIDFLIILGNRSANLVRR